MSFVTVNAAAPAAVLWDIENFLCDEFYQKLHVPPVLRMWKKARTLLVRRKIVPFMGCLVAAVARNWRTPSFEHLRMGLEERGIDLLVSPTEGREAADRALRRAAYERFGTTDAASHLNSLVLMSGDNDFAPFLEKMRRRHGYRIVVIKPWLAQSRQLRHSADLVLSLRGMTDFVHAP